MLLNAFVLAGVIRFVRRQGVGDGVQVAVDSLLGWYFVQYLAVALSGIASVLTFGSIAAVAVSLVALLQFVPAVSVEPIETFLSNRDRRFVFAGTALVVAVIAAIFWNQDAAPTLSNDALTYQLPAAASWLQTHRVGIFPTWFFNPANAYSPLAGSTFVAWWMAPLGNDVLARFVSGPPLLLIFLAMIQVVRGMKQSMAVAVLIALAAVFARPFISQVELVKDDLFLAAFFVLAVAAMSRDRLDDRLGAWRLGAAIGLFFATKYTALLSLPLMLVALDAPWRAGWRLKRHVIAVGVAGAIALPWYLRTWIATGNPIFPTEIRIAGVTVFHGMFVALRSERLIGFRTIVNTFTGSSSGAGYYNLSNATWLMLITGWIAIAIGMRRKLRCDPLIRLVAIGPVVGIATFIVFSPYGETRFVYPSVLLLFAGIGVIASRNAMAVAVAAVLAATSIATAFEPRVLQGIGGIALAAIVIGGSIAALIEALIVVRRAGNLKWIRSLGAVATLFVLSLFAWAFVAWNRYVNTCRVTTDDVWALPSTYGELGEAWRFVRESLPPDAPLAYANTYYVYPLMGFDLDRRVFYVPVRAGVQSIADLGTFESPTSGEKIARQMIPLTNRGADETAWRENLRKSGAKYLFVSRQDLSSGDRMVDPPELIFAEKEPADFVSVYSNALVRIFEIRN